MNASTKRRFHDPMDFVRGAGQPPSEPQSVSGSEVPPPAPVKVVEPPVVIPAKPDVTVAPPQVPVPQIPSRRAPPTRPANVRIPEALHEELRQFWKDTDIPMSEVIIEGTRQRLAELKKQYGME
jgi:hypothetical protein